MTSKTSGEAMAVECKMWNFNGQQTIADILVVCRYFEAALFLALIGIVIDGSFL
jgi:hypothetical protein